MSGGLPPRNASDSSNAARSSSKGGSSSNKSQRTSKSGSPSGSANNNNGISEVNRRLRSVLSHRLGLPLWYMLNVNNEESQQSLERTELFEFINKILGRDSNNPFPGADDVVAAASKDNLDTILETTVTEWVKTRENEPQLTQLLSEAIEKECDNTGFHSTNQVSVYIKNRPNPAHMDLLFSPKEENNSTKPSTPLAIIEVGRGDLDWWLKLDQNVQYLDGLGAHQEDYRLKLFDKEPLLFAVLTIGGKIPLEKDRVKLGVFLCYRNSHGDTRMILLSHFKTKNLLAASKAFGRLLLATSCLGRWRKERVDKAVDYYQYFSSNCCRVDQHVSSRMYPRSAFICNASAFVGELSFLLKYFSTHQQVLRSYDSRVRPTNRSPEIYLSPACCDLIGGKKATVVAEFKIDTFNHGGDNGDWSWDDDDDYFWSDPSQGRRRLLIIATLFREGSHMAKSATAFLEVIDQLALLHEKGFVHGDIRAFNTVFNEPGQDSNKASCLIDFDFGGPIGDMMRYPEGYHRHLDDGDRRGKEKEKIEKWHDWYALGQLIFTIHLFDFPKNVSDELQLKFLRLLQFWSDIRKEPTQSDIADLKNALSELDNHNVLVTPNQKFNDALVGFSTHRALDTYKGATGSPPEKKHQN